MTRPAASSANPPLKIVVTGPVGAGKTTAIGAVSDIDPVRTDEVATDETAFRKPRTTVAMDFGLIRLDDAEVHLYGTPGQRRFDFMWEILSEGAVGVVILIDCTMPSPDRELRNFLRAFEPLISSSAVAVGVSHTDLIPGFSPAPLHQVMQEEGAPGPILSIDPRRRSDVALLIETLVATLDREALA